MAVQKKNTGARRSTRRAGATAKAARSRVEEKVTGSAAATKPEKTPRRARAKTAKAVAEPPRAPLFANTSAATERSSEALRLMEAAITRAISAPNPATDLAIDPAARLMEAGAEQTRQAYARAHATNESLHRTMTETANAATRGAIEIQEKVLVALRAQSDATFDLWRSTLAASSVPEAVRVQTTGAREVYEIAARHWQDVAATTARWLGATIGPFQATLMTGPR